MGSSPFASPLPLSPALFRACFNKLLELRFYCFPNWSRSLSTSTRSQRSLATSSISSSLIIFVLRIREKLVDRPPVAFPLLSTKQKKNLLHFLGKYLWHLQRAAILPAPVWYLSLSALCSLADCALLWPKQEAAGCATNCCRKSDLCVVKVVALS